MEWLYVVCELPKIMKTNANSLHKLHIIFGGFNNYLRCFTLYSLSLASNNFNVVTFIKIEKNTLIFKPHWLTELGAPEGDHA